MSAKKTEKSPSKSQQVDSIAKAEAAPLIESPEKIEVVSEQELKEAQIHPEEPKNKVYFKPIDQMIQLNDTMPEIKSVWGGIKEGSFGNIFGPSKSGKTIFCENLGLSIAAGCSDFMENKIEVEKQKVLFVSFEEYWRFRTRRNKMQVDALKTQGCSDFEVNYLTMGDGFPRYLLTKEDWSLFEENIKQSECKIVFIDSLTRMIDGHIEESATASKVSQKLRGMAYKLNITMIVIHHTRKQNGKAINIDSLAGSRVLAQEADFMIGINKTLSGTRYMKEVAFRYQKENDDFVYSFSINKDYWIEKGLEVNEFAILETPENDGRRDDTNMIKVLEEIKLKSGEDHNIVKTKDLQVRFVDTRIMTKPTLHTALKKLEDIKKIEKVKKGEYRLKE